MSKEGLLKFILLFVIVLALPFLILIHSKAEAGSLVAPDTYARLKSMSPGYFTKIQNEMVAEDVSSKEAEDIIFNYIRDLDNLLQAQLREGTLNKDNFGAAMGNANLELMFRYPKLLSATLSMLEKEGLLDNEDPVQVIQDVISGKRALPPDLQQFYDAVRQEVLYDEISKAASSGGSGGGSGGSSITEPRVEKFVPEKNATKKEKKEKAKELPFKDVPGTHWALKDIKKLYMQEIIGGYPDNTFRPSNNITRAEFTKILIGVLGLPEKGGGTPVFSDVPASAWYYGCVQAAAKTGLVRGCKGKFRPGDPVTRQEMAVMLVRALGIESEAKTKAGEPLSFKDDQKVAPWARGAVAIAADKGLITGYPDNTFGPRKKATRAETAAMINRFLEK